MPWVYLFVASLFQVAWTFSLKYMDVKKLADIKWLAFFNNSNGIIVVLPILGNIIFGLVNVYFLSLAMKSISTGTAFAVWMGIALIGIKVVDIGILKEPFTYPQLAFVLLVLIGILGLKSGT